MSTSRTNPPSDPPSRCPHCGSALAGVESATCPHCGRLLVSESAAPPPPPANPQTARPAVGPPPPIPVPPVEGHTPASSTPAATPPAEPRDASAGPTVVDQRDPKVLSPAEKARLRSKVRIVVACFSALILLATYLVLLALSK